MTIKYSLNQNDFLQHQLYIASKNNSVKNQRRKGWFITTLAFSVLGGIFYQDGNKLMMYYFLAASAPDYAHLSPTVLLIEALYIKAVQEKCTYVDLGISSVEGVLNEGLYAFKRHLRAEECLKKNYRFTF